MSACRFRLIAVVALGLSITTFTFMFFLSGGLFGPTEPYASLPYRIFEPLYFLIIFTLRWLYETPLETVQEVARLKNGRWARQIAALKPDDLEQPEQAESSGNTGEYNLSDYAFYAEAGSYICAALAHGIFWLWLVFPVQYFCLTIPPALAGAFYVWRSRMSFLGPSYQFACEREIEDREDAMCQCHCHCQKRVLKCWHCE